MKKMTLVQKAEGYSALHNSRGEQNVRFVVLSSACARARVSAVGREVNSAREVKPFQVET